MRTRLRLLLVAGLACTSPATPADTLYVIDRLNIGLHNGRSPESAIIKLLPTGTPLEVLQRDDESVEVRDPQGVTGWVDARYVTAQLAASHTRGELEQRVIDTQQELQQARIHIAELKSGLSKKVEPDCPAPAPVPAQPVCPDTGDERAAGAAPVDHAPVRNEGLIGRIQTIETWQIVLFVTTFVVGFIGGAAFLDWLNRRRHGGFRI